jgi:hypothetical protein
VAEQYRALIADPEFEVLVGSRLGWINVEEYEQAIATVDRLLQRIRAAS